MRKGQWAFLIRGDEVISEHPELAEKNKSLLLSARSPAPSTGPGRLPLH